MSAGIVSLCTGMGALDHAVQEVFGGDLIAVADTDRAASKLLAHHYPDVPNVGDITAVDWSLYAAAEWLTAGWPCQPWSIAGLKKGLEDERAIWPAVVRAVRDIRPRHVLLENVSEIVALGELARAVGDLAALGYVGSWRRVSAAEVGLAHLRHREFIVASDAYADGAGLEGRGAGGGAGERAAGARGVADRRPAVPWAEYTGAVRRAERAIGRPAPPIAVLNANGGLVLSPHFDEWHMGVPAGWVTSVPGLSRADMIRLCGNGVVKQAAVAALRAHFAMAQAPSEVAA